MRKNYHFPISVAALFYLAQGEPGDVFACLVYLGREAVIGRQNVRFFVFFVFFQERKHLSTMEHFVC